MVLNDTEQQLIGLIQSGLPLCSRPWAEIGQQLNLAESEVLQQVRSLQERGLIKRFGLVVRHHELGYTANAMVVWDVPDDQVRQVGEALGRHDCVTLCYQRPRRLPQWPYNLFCMIHGKDRERVLETIDELVEAEGLQDIAHEVLFSGERFKQRGAKYL
ncbi:siroheme decarboxylase subunit beta [Thiolapillus brandeum]|uniref:siroheme decarboxylase n=1 Tax=Thiolapillus brandeum TaxID=1076588 RepID=A0A7U6GL08_9GAMM|nr:Lrp/AsnC family transcriptional regulator [Thiolapillus brandeum]BAO45585.1 heme d1 biosynthesis transcriptional regulator [Thiolapillus brandeum]